MDSARTELKDNVEKLRWHQEGFDCPEMRPRLTRPI